MTRPTGSEVPSFGYRLSTVATRPIVKYGFVLFQEYVTSVCVCVCVCP